MKFYEYSTQHNELVVVNPAHIVALRTFISDDVTSARLEIHTTSSTLQIVLEFDNVEKMREEFERVERLMKQAPPAPAKKVNVIRAKGYDPEQDKPRHIPNWSLEP